MRKSKPHLKSTATVTTSSSNFSPHVTVGGENNRLNCMELGSSKKRKMPDGVLTAESVVCKGVYMFEILLRIKNSEQKL